MDNNKQPQLNGAYYGPSIPPAEHPHQHSHRRRGCCCCLFNILWITLVTIIILVALAILIFYLIVQPRPFKFTVTEAKLTEFNYTNNTLHYNLVLNFTARNPNKKLQILYDKAEGQAFYEGTRFNTTDEMTWLNSFRQYTKTTNRTSGVFSGKQVMVLDQDQLSHLQENKRSGIFDIDVKIYFTIRFSLNNFIPGDMKAKAKCELKVPLSSSNGTTVAAFKLTKCDVSY
ncbi:hypothetical protein TanjilG_10908 [Lupinus angustifolius]|uniref:Late embryogenesis abundant protein LEA-2 subgroup domain-containing protein n=1 Tax=Lupinus angustifolius TaxID=3871 RepID=A0A394DF45_LUPAN|nr:PREDICTED: NDR1/HIN1-Like protein 3-like [Lupinus angustifolius]OIW21792.1 hypothetical protein TanjilG_10908 [Lupinus angustifolius]